MKARRAREACPSVLPRFAVCNIEGNSGAGLHCFAFSRSDFCETNCPAVALFHVERRPRRKVGVTLSCRTALPQGVCQVSVLLIENWELPMKTFVHPREARRPPGLRIFLLLRRFCFAIFLLASFLLGGCGHHLKDPALPGHFTVLSWQYQPAPANPADPLWTDVSSYFNSPDWSVPYTMNHVPLHGIVRYPKGNGPFPLVL